MYWVVPASVCIYMLIGISGTRACQWRLLAEICYTVMENQLAQVWMRFGIMFFLKFTLNYFLTNPIHWNSESVKAFICNLALLHWECKNGLFLFFSQLEIEPKMSTIWSHKLCFMSGMKGEVTANCEESHDNLIKIQVNRSGQKPQ